MMSDLFNTLKSTIQQSTNHQISPTAQVIDGVQLIETRIQEALSDTESETITVRESKPKPKSIYHNKYPKSNINLYKTWTKLSNKCKITRALKFIDELKKQEKMTLDQERHLRYILVSNISNKTIATKQSQVVYDIATQRVLQFKQLIRDETGEFAITDDLNHPNSVTLSDNKNDDEL